MNHEQFKDKGLSGLCNLGNTCFLNSTLQVLSHTYEFNLFLDKNTYKNRLNNINDSLILLEWDELRKLLWKDNCVVSPNKFVKTFHKLAKIKGQEHFSGFNQNDMPEFLIFMVDCFHNALSREVKMTIDGEIREEKDKVAVQCFERIKQMYEKDYSEIWSLFYGIQVSKLEALSSGVGGVKGKGEGTKGDLLSMSPEPFFILNLPIPENNKSPTLMDCFDLYTQTEILDSDILVTNEKTGEKTRATQTILFWSFPNVLVIDIKRFSTTNKKNQIMVDFPLTDLDLSKYVIGYNNDSYIYELYGVCNHSGGVLGGHYTSFVKNANGKWYFYNDNNVMEVTDHRQIVTPKAYCFFYRKVC